MLVKPIIRVQNAPSLTVDSIELTETETVFYMTISFLNRTGGWIQTPAPNTKNAFQMKAGSVFYPLKKANNIAFTPKKNEMKEGEKRSFELYFDAIPADIEALDLWEGLGINDIVNSWGFYGIQLKQPEKRGDLRTIFNNKNDFENYYQANLKALNDKERFWILKAETNKKRKKVVQKKPFFAGIDTIASIIEFGQLRFYDMKGNLLKIKTRNIDSPRFYFVFVMEERIVATKTQSFQKNPLSKTKVKKSAARKIWGIEFDKKAKYYDTVMMEMLGIIL